MEDEHWGSFQEVTVWHTVAGGEITSNRLRLGSFTRLPPEHLRLRGVFGCSGFCRLSPPTAQQNRRQPSRLCGLSAAIRNRALASAPQVVTLQASLLRSQPPDHVRLAVLDFVSSLGKLLLSQALQVITLNSIVPVNKNSVDY